MEQNFSVLGDIATVRGATPIRFAHQLGPDHPDSHTLHLNNYLEIYVYVRGNHHYMVENRIYELQRGDVVLIDPRQVHKALPLSPCLYERFYLLVDARCLSGLAVDPLGSILHAGNLLSPPAQLREQVLQLLYGISDCFAGGHNRQTQALGLTLQLLDICSRLCTGEPRSTAPAPALLERILTYVADNTASIQSTSQIADALGLSPQYLSTYFSKRIGTPLKTYIQAKKIALAKELLDKGSDVTGACFDSGFNDCSYFIRVFKKYVGETPLHYKSKIAAGEITQK